MLGRFGLWLALKSMESLAKGALTWENGEKIRTKVIDKAIERAVKAKTTKTKVDNQALMFYAGIMKSDRLKAALEQK